ncbi:bifunctional phosphopantothenoylcysteine decarboxylase/phosphopantothenate--cysteine ligase CoaBC [Skermanella mucosa]|uniref:bifunctional phosphopantothenoylcysteine decarboxylase/phosphopantothenate--cysteine ligase CoaBC n=1 Tax=Skermanella mucosa TaxID=1789672 RepID=UPI00192C9D43|nr:bifunctional phosphopantothenoylcysteine decarboxylase/phosphopantothenate--cysteine ligase CoaBC [Skermanella mucosa]UEM21209.1 bifunctional phosphopantothenoylcysteine decarboxylase/phosphopantothenate--cysteine ligase CoaBC [Skermanella mucosa]
MADTPFPEHRILDGKRILLIISGGIAAYKCLDLIRRLKERGARVRCVLTEGGSKFVTPLSVAALSEEKVYMDLWSLTDEAEMGHIRLSREADLVVVAPASANILAKMAAGITDDLATTALLATDKPVMVAPAMNIMMWSHPATQANMATLESRGILRIGPGVGDMACGETGSGRMSEPMEILGAIAAFFGRAAAPREEAPGPLRGWRALVTSGPTYEPIDPVRYIANRSSGKQGHAIAAALARLGASVTLVSGPTREPDPDGVAMVHVESARDMLAACQDALPVDVAVCAAAVADWRVRAMSSQKLKKDGGHLPALELAENPDILATLSRPGRMRPGLVVGFAAETEKVVAHARAKLARKGCDWIVANDVSPSSGTFGGTSNTVHLLRGDTLEDWPPLSKEEVAQRLAAAIADHLVGTGAE